MPEMKGRSLEELDEMFLEKVRVKDFTKYECGIKEDALRHVRGESELKRGVMERREDIEVPESIGQDKVR